MAGAVRVESDDDSEDSQEAVDLTIVQQNDAVKNRGGTRTLRSRPGRGVVAGGTQGKMKQKPKQQGAGGKKRDMRSSEAASDHDVEASDDMERAVAASKSQLAIDTQARAKARSDEKEKIDQAKVASLQLATAEEEAARAKREAENAASLREAKLEHKRKRKEKKRKREEAERDAQLQQDSETRQKQQSEQATKRHTERSREDQCLRDQLEAERARSYNIEIAAWKAKADQDAEQAASDQLVILLRERNDKLKEDSINDKKLLKQRSNAEFLAQFKRNSF